MQGRSPVLTCRDCKACVDGCPVCDGPLMAVPCDDAAIERVARRKAERDGFWDDGPGEGWDRMPETDRELLREEARDDFRAAGETPTAPEPAGPRFSERTIRRWKAYEDHRIRTQFTENICAHMPMPEAQRIRDEAFAAMEDPNWLPEHAKEAKDA